MRSKHTTEFSCKTLSDLVKSGSRFYKPGGGSWHTFVLSSVPPSQAMSFEFLSFSRRTEFPYGSMAAGRWRPLLASRFPIRM